MNAVRTVEDLGELRRDEPMSKHTSWRVGGTADLYFRPASKAALVEFLTQLEPGTPVHWVGLGSNLLVRDGGIRGVVISTANALGGLQRMGEQQVEAEAGVPCTVFARRCTRWGLGPAEFFAGIPGTIGGALAMNAGAFEGETWDHVVEVETVDRTGTVRSRDRADFDVSYREVGVPPGEWFLAARFRFDEIADANLDRVRALLQERQQKQPLGLPSCGSVFRNPPGDHAARLIESAGLKSLQIGGARVSDKHANFIINTGDASAADIEQLIRRVQAEVARVHGVELVPEVHILGTAEART
ncbi:MAG TPA: UDP-N-acetylmuramate dehydrogenase [Chromatiales bacterium]|nr:UDP-N-acetylmuramate dehydrogenase [Chromatiales bacterium]